MRWLAGLFAERIINSALDNTNNWNSFYIIAIPIGIIALFYIFGKIKE